MNILHLSDLHIDSPDCCEEILRKGFFKEYVTNLKKTVSKHCGDIDYIFVTGDIVNISKSENYQHASDLLNYFSEIFNVSTDSIFVTVGNHDKSRASSIDTSFNRFSEKYANANGSVSRERYGFIKKDEAGFLWLDSTGSDSKKGEPCNLSNAEIDEITNLVRESNIHDLFVVSHHPVDGYEIINQAPWDEENSGYHSKHFWMSGGYLVRRLSTNGNVKRKLICFSGDVHRHEFNITEGEIKRAISSVGSLNIIPPKPDLIKPKESKLPPSVRVVEVDSLNSFLFEYRLKGHFGRSNEGKWEYKPEEKNTRTLESEVDIKPNGGNSKQLIKDEDCENKYHLLCKKLEIEIDEAVRERGAYEFGIFNTNSEYSSLAWISIQKLVNNSLLYPSIVYQMSNKINEIVENKSVAILIGLDTWGAILASRLSLATGIRNCCVGINTNRNSYDDLESINEKLKEKIEPKKDIFVISDVLSTGSSVKNIFDELNTGSDKNWYSVSIICDIEQDRHGKMDAFKRVYYACGNILIPILPKSKLPKSEHQTAIISYLEEDKK